MCNGLILLILKFKLSFHLSLFIFKVCLDFISLIDILRLNFPYFHVRFPLHLFFFLVSVSLHFLLFLLNSFDFIFYVLFYFLDILFISLHFVLNVLMKALNILFMIFSFLVNIILHLLLSFIKVFTHVLFLGFDCFF